MNPPSFTLTPIGVDALPSAAAAAAPFVPQEDNGPAAAIMGSAAAAVAPPFERENTNVKVSDWPMSNAELRRRAEYYGKVISVNVQASKNRRTRHGFVNFVHGASAAACIEDGMGQFEGHPRELSTFRDGGSAPTPKVYIDGLPAGGMDDANVPLLRHAFEVELRLLSQALQIVSIDPPSRRETAKSSCIVEFTSTPSYEVLERLRDITTLPVGASHFPVTLFVKYNQPPQQQQQQQQQPAPRHPPPFPPVLPPGLRYHPQVSPPAIPTTNAAPPIGHGVAGHHHYQPHPLPNTSLFGGSAATAVPPHLLQNYFPPTAASYHHHHHHHNQATSPYLYAPPHPHPHPQQQQPYGTLFHHPHESLQQHLASLAHAGWSPHLLPGASSAFPQSQHLGAAFAAQPPALYPLPQHAAPFAPHQPHQHQHHDHGLTAAGWPPVSHHSLQQQQPAAVASFYPYSPS